MKQTPAKREVELTSGREALRTNPIAFEGEATKGEDATKIGAGAIAQDARTPPNSQPPRLGVGSW